MADTYRVLTRRMETTGDDLGILGFGCMRFPRKYGATDMDRAERQVMRAIAAGVNYFDTAYLYPGNEKALGTILAKEDDGVKRRDRVKIATKLPLMLVKNEDDLDKMFRTSLERLQTDRIDYYLMHNINNLDEWERMKRLGVLDFIGRIRANGSVKHIGFSYHGNLHDFKVVVDDYPWDFCQIQYNYLDENFQAGREGLKYAAAKGLGIVVMEPLRGGMLIDKMPPAAKKIIDGYTDGSGAKRSAAEWGLRWIWNHPEVATVLSGMNEEAHIDENVRVASDAAADSLTAEDLAMLGRVRNVFKSAVKVGCTGCSYCMPCPAGVNIPLCFALYNNKYILGSLSNTISYIMYTDGIGNPPSKASLCKKCGVCEKKCPQNIPIMSSLEDVAREMENPLLRLPVRIAGKLMGR
ncbi:MAG: aldo/keto reductase [Clostridiales Family XIII bacterium]|nr:aldo/keto reductase [Clostridiales Family XIII bacterium]